MKYEITQDDVNQYVANGGDLSLLTFEQSSSVKQEYINQHAAKGRNLMCITAAQLKAIPQKYINEYLLAGGDPTILFMEQKKAVPEKIKNQLNSNAGVSFSLSKKGTENLSREFINLHAARYGHNGLGDLYIKAAKQITMPSQDTKNAIILYALGKLPYNELPKEVYVNHNTRKILLDIIKTNLMQEYNEICEKHGYKDQVPDCVVGAFDKKLNQVEKEIETKMLETVTLITNKHIKQSENDTAAAEEINNLRW